MRVVETAKSETAVLIVVVAKEDTETPAAAVTKALGTKDARMAAADAVKAALGVEPTDGKYQFVLLHARSASDKLAVSPLSITSENAASVQVALDQKLVDTKAKIGLHPSKSSETVFVTADELKSSLEKSGVKLTVVDFSLVNMYGFSGVLVLKV